MTDFGLFLTQIHWFLRFRAPAEWNNGLMSLFHIPEHGEWNNWLCPTSDKSQGYSISQLFHMTIFHMNYSTVQPIYLSSGGRHIGRRDRDAGIYGGTSTCPQLDTRKGFPVNCLDVVAFDCRGNRAK